MEIKKITGNVKPIQTVEEFDALLEKYKLQNPTKFALKVASGEFDRKRALLAGKPETKNEEKVTEIKVKEPVKKSK